MKATTSIKVKLAAMNFLEFAVWGAYLTCMGNYLGNAGMGKLIPWFYAIQGIVSIFMPAIMGIVADKFIQPQRLLGICHFLAGLFMCACWWLGNQSADPDPTIFVACYTISVAFFMPTIALANTVAFRILNDNRLDTIKDFPPIRVLGTVGFIATMWFVNCAYISDGSFGFSLSNPLIDPSLPENAQPADPRFQYTCWQFMVSGLLSVILAIYCFMLPQCRIVKTDKKGSLAESLGLTAFKLFKTRKMLLFFIFSMLLGMCLQVTNGYAGPYITSFKAIPALADTFGAQNATLLTSLSQISEALCILLIPFFLRRYGIKVVMAMSMFAWVLRFGFFGLGDPGIPGVFLLILSMIVYGVAFDFFNVSGALFIEKETDKSIQASAQGLFMLMTNGLGATIGTLSAGAVIDHFCSWQEVGSDRFLLGDWSTAWYIFASFALVVAVSFIIMFKYKHNPAGISRDEAADLTLDAPEGFTNDKE